MFTGHERDFSTGSDYMHARHYHNQLGRFTSVDPLRGSPGEPQFLNRYAYVSGNPLNMIEPTGMTGEQPQVELPLDNWARFGGGYGRAGGGYDNFGSSFWNFFGSGPTSVSDKHRTAFAAQEGHQDFKPGWLSNALGPGWGFPDSGAENDSSNTNLLTFAGAAFPGLGAGVISNYWHAIEGGYRITTVGQGQNIALFDENGFSGKENRGSLPFPSGRQRGTLCPGSIGSGTQINCWVHIQSDRD